MTPSPFIEFPFRIAQWLMAHHKCAILCETLSFARYLPNSEFGFIFLFEVLRIEDQIMVVRKGPVHG